MNGNISLNIKKLLSGSTLMIYFQRKEISMKELKVGERITLEAVEQYGCRGCFFENDPVCINFACSEGVRSDGKSVIFKEVKE